MTRSAVKARPTDEQRACEWCGEDFKVYKEHRNWRKRVCSPKCNAQQQHAKAVAKYPSREEVVRLYIGEQLSDKEFGRRFGHSHQWSLKVRRHYEIPGHRLGHHRKPLSQQKDRQRWAIALKREPCCRNCGGVGRLDLHHAVPRSLSPAGKYDLRNGVPLCQSCHTLWHHGKAIPRSVFTAEEWAFIETLIGPTWLDKKYPQALSEAA